MQTILNIYILISILLLQNSQLAASAGENYLKLKIDRCKATLDANPNDPKYALELADAYLYQNSLK